jgi:hypothetical protein
LSITVSPLANSQQFGTWFVRMNQIASIISSNTVTADSSNAGSLTSGNSYVNGVFGSLTLVANNIGGGTLQTPANLTFTTNVFFSANVTANVLTAVNSIKIGNSTSNATVNSTIYSGSAFFANLATAALIANNSLFLGGVAAALYAPLANPAFTGTATVGANVSLSTALLSIGNTTANTVVNSTSITTPFANVTGNVVVGGSLFVTGNVVTTGTQVANGNLIPALDNTYQIGNSSVRFSNGSFVNLSANLLTIGSATINSTAFSGLANNATNFAGQPQSFYANVTSYPGAFKGTTVNATTGSFGGLVQANAGLDITGLDTGVGGQVRLTLANYSVLLRNDDTSMFFLQTASGNAAGTFNAFRPLQWSLATGAITIDGTGLGTTLGGVTTIQANASVNGTFTVGNSTIFSTVNSSVFSGTSLQANNSTNFGGNPVSFYANVTSPIFTTSVNVGSNVSLSTISLSIGNSTVNSVLNSVSHTFGPTVVNTSIVTAPSLSGNTISVGNSTVNGSISATAYSGTANNAVFVGSTSAANVVSNTQLAANLANYTNTADLSAVVATLTANNASNLGGHLPAFYANASSYTGAFNGTTVSSSSWANFTGQVNASAGVVSIGGDNSGAGGQFRLIDSNYGAILRNDDTSFYIMSTASGNATGTWNAFRPFTYNLANGAVSIDSTGANVTFGGSVSAANGFVQAQLIATKTIANATYTLTNADSGSVLLCVNTSATTITVANTLQANTRFIVTRIAAANVIISNNAGVTLGSRTNNYNPLAQYGSVSIMMANTTLAVIDGNI